MAELRRDFRVHYHCSYDDVGVDEAIDLIRMLPKRDSKWRFAHGDLDAAWTEAHHLTADIIDMMAGIAGAQAGIPANETYKVTRPSDAVERAKEMQKAKAASMKIKTTEWEDE